MNAEFMIDGLRLTTDRLILRAFQEEDLEDFFTYAKVEEVGEMAGWKHHESIEETRTILDRFIKGDHVFAIVLKESGKVIGSLGIERYGMENRLTEFQGLRGRELGFVLSRDYWGQGLMPEAVKRVIDYLFYDYGLDFLTSGYFVENVQSKRVQEKCLFKPYRKLKVETCTGTHDTILNLLLNPSKRLTLEFSHPETLIINPS